MSRWVTIRRFDNPLEANIIKSLLESEEIPAFLLGEQLLSTQLLYNVMMGDCCLLVPEELVTVAKQVLADYRQGNFQTPLENTFNLNPIACQKCGGKEFQEVSDLTSKLICCLMAFYFVGRVLPPLKYKVCKQCHCRLQEAIETT